MPTQLARKSKTASARDKRSHMRLRGDLAYLSQHSSELLKKYGGAYVAISNRKLVAHSRSLRTLQRKLREMEIGADEVIVDFLTDETRTLIL